MLLKSLKLTNFLSFGPDAEPIELRALNMLIGPNGSGKSNFIERSAYSMPRRGSSRLPCVRAGAWASGSGRVMHLRMAVGALTRRRWGAELSAKAARALATG